MAFIERTLVEHLRGVSALTALVGQKIYPGIIPQGTALPAITFMPIGGGPTHSMTGSSGYEMREYRFTVYTDKKEVDTMLQITDALQTAIDGYRGSMGTTYVTVIQRIMLKDIRDFFEPDSEAHQRVLEFDIDYCA